MGTGVEAHIRVFFTTLGTPFCAAFSGNISLRPPPPLFRFYVFTCQVCACLFVRLFCVFSSQS